LQESKKGSASSQSSYSTATKKREYSTPRKSYKAETAPAPPPPPADPKPFREKAVKNFEQALRTRLGQDENTEKAAKLKDLAKNVESELYRHHERKVDSKYLAKYRSLLFNLKDEKNDLFSAVLSREITPKQLVSMSAEEMANKELQQWRQKELKHEIETIKKNELDQLARGNKFLVKTHKGEEVKEEKPNVAEVKLPEEVDVPDKKKADEEKAKNEKKRRDKEKDRERRREKDKKHHRHKSSREKDRDKDRHHRHKSSSSRDKDRHHSSKDKKSSSSKEEMASKEDKVKPVEREVQEKVVENDVKESEREKLEEDRRQKAFSEKMAKAEKILKEFKESKLSLEAIDEGDDQGEGNKVQESADDLEIVEEHVVKDSSPAEVTSTVNIVTPEGDGYDREARGADPTVWSGRVDMPDVASFSVQAKAVSGTTDYLTDDLRDVLKIVGRIPPKVVWDYVAQVAAAGAKEILLVRLLPSSDDEKVSYASFFAYLQERKRFGVVGNFSAMVKDCYILPLGPEENLNDCLMPLDGPGLDGDGERPDMLLALVVRSKRKRSRPLQEKLVKAQKARLGGNGGTPPLYDLHEEDMEYDPAMAGNAPDLDSSPEVVLDDEVYDPESAFVDDDVAEPAAKKARTEGLPQFSPPQTTADADSNSRRMLKDLEKKIRQEKQDLASMKGDAGGTPSSSALGPATVEGFQGLPMNIARILYGNKAEQMVKKPEEDKASKSSSSLSGMSDAELLAKAQEMESGPPKQQQLDPRRQPEAPPHHSYFAGPTPPAQPSATSYTDPNWMNTGPPPLPQVAAFNAPPPQQQRQQQQGPWMSGYEPTPTNWQPPPGDRDWRGDDSGGRWRDNHQYGHNRRDHHRRDRGHHRGDQRDRDYRERSDDRRRNRR